MKYEACRDPGTDDRTDAHRRRLPNARGPFEFVQRQISVNVDILTGKKLSESFNAWKIRNGRQEQILTVPCTRFRIGPWGKGKSKVG
jgi:hypothetical protein